MVEAVDTAAAVAVAHIPCQSPVLNWVADTLRANCTLSPVVPADIVVAGGLAGMWSRDRVRLHCGTAGGIAASVPLDQSLQHLAH